MPSTRTVELGFFFLLAAAAAAVSFFILKPYLAALFVAVVFSIVFRPFYEYLLRKLGRPNLASSLSLLILLLVVLIPVTVFGFFIFDDAQRLYISAVQGESIVTKLDALVAPIEERLRAISPDFSVKLSVYAEEALSFFVGNLGSAFSRAVGVVFKTVLMLLALFYLFRDGKKLHAHIVNLSPLANEYDERILRRLEDAISSVVKGKLLIVLIQGILASVGFWLFGIPHPVLFGALTSLAALIPFVGVAVVFVPAVLYLFFAGSVGAAAGLLVAGIIIGSVDNVLGPILFERGLQLHPLLILLSVLGGLAFFGPIGFLAGPVALSLLVALLDIYPLLFTKNQ